MKLILKSMALAVAMYVAGATAGSVSGVGDGTQPNQWTRNISGVLEAAKTTRLPIFSLREFYQSYAQFPGIRQHRPEVRVLHGLPCQGKYGARDLDQMFLDIRGW